jgi:hypothetical protein
MRFRTARTALAILAVSLGAGVALRYDPPVLIGRHMAGLKAHTPSRK